MRRLAATFLACLILSPAPAAAEPAEAGAGFGGAGLAGCHSDLLYLNQLFGWQMGWQRDWQALATAPDRPRGTVSESKRFKIARPVAD